MKRSITFIVLVLGNFYLSGQDSTMVLQKTDDLYNRIELHQSEFKNWSIISEDDKHKRILEYNSDTLTHRHSLLKEDNTEYISTYNYDSKLSYTHSSDGNENIIEKSISSIMDLPLSMNQKNHNSLNIRCKKGGFYEAHIRIPVLDKKFRLAKIYIENESITVLSDYFSTEKQLCNWNKEGHITHIQGFVSDEFPDNTFSISEDSINLKMVKDKSVKIAIKKQEKLIRYELKNGFFHGPFIAFYPNKKKWIECTFNEGLLINTYTLYYPNGEIKEQIHFNDNGLFDGEYLSFSKNKDLLCSGSFLNGYPHGKWCVFNHQNELKEELTFHKGMNTNKRLITEYSHHNGTNTLINEKLVYKESAAVDIRDNRIVEGNLCNGRRIKSELINSNGYRKIYNDHSSFLIREEVLPNAKVNVKNFIDSVFSINCSDIRCASLPEQPINTNLAVGKKSLFSGSTKTTIKTVGFRYQEQKNSSNNAISISFICHPDEKFIFTYDSIREEFFDKNGSSLTKFGISTSIAKKGMSIEGQTKNGLKNGLWQYYYPNGELLASVNFKEDILHGDVKTYWINGQILFSGHYVSGYAQGLFQHWNDKGILFQEESYIKNRLHGERILRNRLNGNVVKHEKFYHGLLHGKTFEFYASGDLKNNSEYFYGNKHGLFESFRENGTLSSQYSFILNKLNGSYSTFHENGALKESKQYFKGVEILD